MRRRRARVHSDHSRGAVEGQSSLLPLRVRGLGRFGCTPSGRSSPSSPALARARAVPLAAQAVRSRTQWQSSGEPSSGGWPTPRGSCATIEIGVRSDARPGSLSAVLGNECANPTHDRVAELRQSFREIRPSLAIALALLVVRLRHVRVALGRSERASSALVRAPSVQGCSGVLGHQLPARAATIRSR